MTNWSAHDAGMGVGFMKRLLTMLLVLTGLAVAQPSQKTVVFARAIAKAEGFGIPKALPTRYHNPGDLKARRGQSYPGQCGIGKGGHVIFCSDRAGWAALYRQVERILTGTSRFYTVNMTLTEVARKYAGNWRVWAGNVARNLGVTPDTTLWAFFDIPPDVKFSVPELRYVLTLPRHVCYDSEMGV
jgi:hypothetical protein